MKLLYSLFMYVVILQAHSFASPYEQMAQNNIYNSEPTDSLPKDIPLPKDNTPLQMQEQQLDLMKKEFRGNPAPSDLIYYKQHQNQKEIQKDSTLTIKPEHTSQTDDILMAQPYEFIITYIFKLVNDVPYGEQYKISTPLVSLQLVSKRTPQKTCTINTKEKHLSITHYDSYTKAEMQASIKKQTQYLLYNLLQEYQSDVLECLILNQAHLDDMNTTINLESRTNTITKVKSYLLVSFEGGILTLQVFNPK